MKQYNNIIKKNDLKVNKYTIKGKSTIVNTPSGQFVLKENKGNNIYKYLKSRNFNFFPKIIDYDPNSIIFEYIDDVNYDNDEKAKDIIHLVSLLHSKTSYFKEIDLDENKNLYEELKNKLEYLYNYYMDIINVVESRVYFSPFEYLVSRNISKIFECINYCDFYLEKWYEYVKDKKRKRVVTLHNNLKLDNLLKNNNSYLISWENNKIDSPIFDLVNFYNKYSLNFDFQSLFSEYQKIFSLLDEEILLMNVLISIPEKINFNDNEYEMVKEIRKILDKIYKTESVVNNDILSKLEEAESTK